MEELYKDSKLIIQKSQLNDALKDICKLIESADRSGNAEKYYIERLLNNQQSVMEHSPSHKKCDRRKSDSEKVTEKRICRCMYYYNADSVKCQRCTLKNKWKNVGEIKVTEYEYPTKYVLKNVGGMDLIFNDEYAVEVKPPESPETLSRMFAEILTYTIGETLEGKKYKPAICIFNTPGNEQMEQFKSLWSEQNESLIKIMNKIKIFYFDVPSLEPDVIEYRIKEINELIQAWK